MKSYLFLLFSWLVLHAFSQSAQVLTYDVQVDVSSNIVETTTRIDLLIFDKSGLDFAEFNIWFDDGNPPKLLHAEATSLAGKTLKKLKTKDIIFKRNPWSKYFADGQQVMTFQLISLELPYKVSVSYKRTEESYLSWIKWRPYYYSNLNHKISSLTVSVPDEPHVVYDPDSLIQKEVADGRISYTARQTNLAPVSREIWSPSWPDLVSEIWAIPNEFRYGGFSGNQKTWSDYARWQAKLNDGLRTLPSDEKIRILGIAQQKELKLEKINAVYQYVQDNHRYVNVSLGIGGLQPKPASYVCENRFGDCKALSNYLIGALQAIDVPAFYSKIKAGRKVESIVQDVPSQQFNHVIVMVPLENDTLWLDPTSSDLPAGYVGSFIQNRKALLVSSNSPGLKHVPALTKKQVTTGGRWTINLTSDSLSFSSYLRGRKYEKWNALNKVARTQDMDNMIRDEIKLSGLSNLDYNAQMVDNYTWKINSLARFEPFWRSYGGSVLIQPLRHLGLSLPAFESPENRTQPVELNLPLHIRDTVIIKKSGYLLSERSDDIAINESFGTFSVQWEQSENAARIVRVLDLKAGVISVQDYYKFYAFINQIKKEERTSYVEFSKSD